MVKHRPGIPKHITRWRMLAVGPALGALLFFSLPARADSHGFDEIRSMGRHQEIPHIIASWFWEASENAGTKHEPDRLARKKKQSRGPAEDSGGNWKGFENLTPEEKARIRQKQREWESLPPERKEMLRQRMEQLNRLPSQDRELFRRRFNQWQELSPQERRGIRKNLEKWDGLSPREQENIRRKFLN
ncbi:MAG: DUF3106 domain-containing protein [Desulfatiglandaceae bacterium]